MLTSTLTHAAGDDLPGLQRRDDVTIAPVSHRRERTMSANTPRSTDSAMSFAGHSSSGAAEIPDGERDRQPRERQHDEARQRVLHA